MSVFYCERKRNMKRFKISKANCNDWLQSVISVLTKIHYFLHFLLQNDGLTPLIGRVLFSVLDSALSQSRLESTGDSVNQFKHQFPIKTCIEKFYPSFIYHISRSSNPIVCSKFRQKFQPTHRNVQSLLISLQAKLKTELKNLLKGLLLETLNK